MSAVMERGCGAKRRGGGDGDMQGAVPRATATFGAGWVREAITLFRFF